MLKKALSAILAIVALATATAVAVVALAVALYAGLAPVLGAACAAAIVAMTFIILVLLCTLLATMGRKPKRRAGDDGLVARVMEIAREKPMLSVGAAIAAGILAVRNPALVATIVAAILDRPRPRD